MQKTEYWERGTKDRGCFAIYVANARRGGRATLQNGSPRKAEDSNYSRAGSKIIANQHATARIVNLALTDQRVRSPSSQRSMPPPFGKLRDAICAITRCFFVLSRTCGNTGVSCSKANSQSSLALVHKCIFQRRSRFTEEYRSGSISKSRSLGEMEDKSEVRIFPCLVGPGPQEGALRPSP